MKNTIINLADRIGGESFGPSTGYKMETIERAKNHAQMMFPGRFFLDMGVEESDAMAPDVVIEELHSQALLPVNRGYANNHCQQFKSAAAQYMEKVFCILIDERNEIVHCVGAKSALSLLPLCFVNPGDVVISTKPSYGVFDVHVQYLGGNVFSLPLLRENNYLPDLLSVPENIARKAKIIHINYPNNPTSAPATYAFFEHLVDFARRYRILIINDASYASLVLRDPLSILQVPEAKKVALEIHSMSKSYNMSGWRLGWVCGNEYAVEAFSVVKDNSDSGQFLAIQKAAVRALQDISFPRRMARKYIRRKRIIGDILQSVGFDVYAPACGIFLYVKVPRLLRYSQQELHFSSAEKFSRWLLESLGILAVGWEEPEPAIRFSMAFFCRTERFFAETLAMRFMGLTAIY